jgi:hypothetical protein
MGFAAAKLAMAERTKVERTEVRIFFFLRPKLLVVLVGKGKKQKLNEEEKDDATPFISACQR